MSRARRARRPAVPAGYVEERERGAHVVALPSAMGAVLAHIATHGSLYGAAAAAGVETYTGRGAAHRVPAEDGDWVVRHYHRGGLIARVLHDRYVRAGETRPLRELRASAAARERGVPTPQVVAAVLYPAGAFYRADLATRHVTGSNDLAAITFADGDPERAAAAWSAAGDLVRRACAAGLEHRDLNLRNILISEIDNARVPHAMLLDLDRAVVHDRAVSDDVGSRMLARLHRSRRKLEAASGRAVPAECLAAFAMALREGA